jgi:hypothetical protein
MADSLESAANIFEKLVSDFTWTRFTIVVFLLFLIGASLVAFESYTRHFALSRIEGEIKSFGELAQLSSKLPVTSNSAQLQRTYDHLLTKLNAQIDGESFHLDELPVWASNAIYAALPWLLMSFLILFTTKTGGAKVYLGMAVVAIPSVIVGAALPEYGRSWINHWVYPWVAIVFCTGLILLWQKLKTNRVRTGA